MCSVMPTSELHLCISASPAAPLTKRLRLHDCGQPHIISVAQYSPSGSQADSMRQSHGSPKPTPLNSIIHSSGGKDSLWHSLQATGTASKRFSKRRSEVAIEKTSCMNIP